MTIAERLLGLLSDGADAPGERRPAEKGGAPRDGRRLGRLSLALQGGGSLGAFSWGVLDRLLEAGMEFDAVSGSSAGAVNAVLLASGLLEGGPAAARSLLARFWKHASDAAGLQFSSFDLLLVERDVALPVQSARHQPLAVHAAHRCRFRAAAVCFAAAAPDRRNPGERRPAEESSAKAS